MYLTVNNISFALNSTFKIDGLSLEIDKGVMVGLIGPNGSGKTTLLKLMSGIFKPYAGNIMLHDQDISTLKHRELACIRAYVPESIDLPFDYAVYEIVALGRHPHTGIFPGPDKKDQAAIDNALELTDTNKLSRRKFFTLSMGEKQRVMLAMAIAQEPELLLLDEPISHLDIGHQLTFIHTLKRLHKNGITIISAMHELPLAMEFFDRLCLMDNGRIVRYAPSGDKGLMENIKSIFGVSDERFIK
jgi:ABC-type cobalamin/Fe3+-siderophores transport system ATPase subunit